MNFFRKNFVLILAIGIGLIVLASVLPYFTRGKQSKVEIQTSDIQVQEPPFTHEGNLSFFKKTGEQIADFEVELAQNPLETELGLMYRKTMAQNRGMLFIFPDVQMRSFWMKNTYIPLDIIYLDAEKQVVSISKNAQPLSEESRPSEAPAKYVLELNAGVCDQKNIQKGDYITFEVLNQ